MITDTNHTAESRPSALYAGRVMHHRLRPFRQRFTYRVWSLLVDLEALDDLDGRLRLFSYNRRNLVAFFDRDHGPRDGSPLLPWARQQLHEAGIAGVDGPISLFSFPRVLGYVFNPLSVYYCHDRGGRLRALIYEVKNTFGGQHTYTFAVDPDRPLKHGCDKAFYVSPFIQMQASYRFALNVPAERLNLVIRESVPEGLQLIASFSGDRLPMTDTTMAQLLARHGAVTLGVTLGIHWQAIKLWWRGARFSAPSRHSPALVAGNSASTAPIPAPAQAVGRHQ